MADPWGSPGMQSMKPNVTHVEGPGTAIPKSMINAFGVKVQVYLDNGVVFEYTVSDAIKGREHAHAITTGGYRHTPQGSNDLVWYPAHRILQVKVQGGGESTQYKDTARAT